MTDLMTNYQFNKMRDDVYSEWLMNYCCLFMDLLNDRMIEDRNEHDLYMHQRQFNNYKFYDC